MRKLKNKTNLKHIEHVKLKTEKHIVCMNPKICKEKIQPDITCKDCRYINVIEVEIAESKTNYGVDLW